jgi:ribosomal protein L39E
MVSRHNRKSKKRHLEKAGTQTRWAPFWTVLRKFGVGKKIHPSSITHIKRSWRHKKLKIKPRRIKKPHYG